VFACWFGLTSVGYVSVLRPVVFSRVDVIVGHVVGLRGVQKRWVGVCGGCWFVWLCFGSVLGVLCFLYMGSIFGSIVYWMVGSGVLSCVAMRFLFSRSCAVGSQCA